MASQPSSDQVQKGARRFKDLLGSSSEYRGTMPTTSGPGLSGVLASWWRAGDSEAQDAPNAEIEAPCLDGRINAPVGSGEPRLALKDEITQANLRGKSETAS